MISEAKTSDPATAARRRPTRLSLGRARMVAAIQAGDDEHADQPLIGQAGVPDNDAGPRVPDRSRLGLAVLLDVLVS